MKDRAIPTSETKSACTMGTVLKQAFKVATANTAAIARVTEKEDVKTLMYQFDFDVPGKYTVKEVEVMIHVPEYLESFEHAQDMEMCAFMDLFNDKIDFEACKKWNDIVNLNLKLGKLISKLEMLRETPVALDIANKLLQNILKIQPVVKSVEFALLESHAHSQLTSRQVDIDKLN